jgi:hypothetical protein
MTLESIKQAIHKLDLINKPYALYANPSDAATVKDLIPDNVKLVEVPYVEKGKVYLMDRKAIEKIHFFIQLESEDYDSSRID